MIDISLSFFVSSIQFQFVMNARKVWIERFCQVKKENKYNYMSHQILIVFVKEIRILFLKF